MGVFAVCVWQVFRPLFPWDSLAGMCLLGCVCVLFVRGEGREGRGYMCWGDGGVLGLLGLVLLLFFYCIRGGVERFGCRKRCADAMPSVCLHLHTIYELHWSAQLQVHVAWIMLCFLWPNLCEFIYLDGLSVRNQVIDIYFTLV